MDNLVVVRGGGDIATGTIYKLARCGFHVLVLEIAHPSAIRRNVAYSEAVYDGHKEVEGIECVLIHLLNELESVFKENKIAMMVDPEGSSIDILKPEIVIDAILAKKNMGTSRNMAPITIGLGPGFNAGKDVDIVAYPFTEMERVIEGVDVALLGPQVGYQLARAKEICDPKGVPVDVIPMQDYGMCNGMNVLKFAYKLAKNK